MQDALDSASLAERLVLLSVADISATQEEPAAAHDIRRVCRDHMTMLDDGAVGSFSEADVMRTLYALEEDGLLEDAGNVEVSAVGKGRPTYRLGIDANELLDVLVTDERLTPLVDTLRDRH